MHRQGVTTLNLNTGKPQQPDPTISTPSFRDQFFTICYSSNQKSADVQPREPVQPSTNVLGSECANEDDDPDCFCCSGNKRAGALLLNTSASSSANV